MPSNTTSDTEKGAIREYLCRLIGEPKQPVSYRPDLLVSGDGLLCVFVTYSAGEDLFYDVSEKDLVEWDGHARAFIIFLMGNRERALVVPARLLHKELVRAGRSVSDKYGDYKLHLVQQPGVYYFRELPDWELSRYFNNYVPLLAPSSS